MSVPGKIYRRILTERLMQLTEKKVNDGQGGFRKGKSVDQIYAIKMLVEEYLGKDRKLYVAYDKVDREALWNVLKIYDVGGQVMKGIKALYRGANARLKVDGELRDSFAIGVGGTVRQGYAMFPWFFNIFIDGCMKEMKAKVGKYIQN